MSEFNGNEVLRELTKKAGYNSLSELVAANTLFTHPDTVSQTKCRNIFRTIRNAGRRGTIDDYNDGSKVMYCDNEGPNRTFVWSNRDFKYKDVQFNHIYSDSQNVEIYTSLANICVTPAFIAKLTDTDDEVKKLLKYRSFDLYGFFQGERPTKPAHYEKLSWMKFIDPINDLEEHLLARMNACKKSRSSISARKIGWYFSGYQPENRISE